MIVVDPGNYATDVAAGATYQFRLLFIVLLSNIFAIFLQSLAIKLGTVSGLNLAEACRAFLPRWLNYFLYIMAEAAIIATDIAEVIGTAIAINLLIPQIPLVAGCALSILDVMVILFFYQPNGTMRGLRAFEFFVVLLVLAVVICFCIQLSLIDRATTTVGHVFKGYLPSSAIVEQKGLYQACGILGATVMPHSLYLGSGVVQARLKDYDEKKGLLPADMEPRSAASSVHEGLADKATYIPSLKAIRHSLKYSIAELAICLFTFALFVNSAILIVAGASLYQNPEAEDADIFGIHDLLSKSISPGAGTVFALALLFSGISAGIVCTIAGQMVSEGALDWTLKPWLRRLVTRSISITPSIIIAGAVGRTGLDAALNGSQVALSVVLPFVTAPLIWFTCRSRYMTVQPGMARFARQTATAKPIDEETGSGSLWRRIIFKKNDGVRADGSVTMANSWLVCIFAVLVWLIITVLNIANLVLLGKQ
jgi:metal iron transporter